MGTAPVLVPAIPDYEIRGLIKEGGMGQVYKAWNISLERFEAIKFITPRLLTAPEMRELFHREAVAVASLDHENIATLYRCGETGSNPYLAFQYCDGGSLANRMQGRRLDAAEIYHYAAGLAAGLNHAHLHGIIHCDIKPANVLFHEGKLKLIDFGLAKYRTESSGIHLARGGGTPDYISPDQIRGEPPDLRSDIYSFGVILYEMAAGRRPFESAHLHDLLRRVCRDQPAPLTELRPDLDPDFCRLVHRALAKVPGARPQSMAEMLSVLRECREKAGVAQPVSHDTPTLPATSPEQLTTVVTPLREPASTPIKSRYGIPLLLGAASLVLLLMNPGWLDRLRSWNSAAPLGKPIIAVLPFDSVSREAAAVEFCGALDARLTGELVQSVRTRDFFAVSPSSEVRSYSIRSVADARKRLKADFVFGGTVIRSESGYEVLLALSDASRQQQIKAETIRIDRQSLDRFDWTLRDAALRMLPPETRAASLVVASAQPFSNPAAYELSVRAQGLLRLYSGPGPVDTAIELLTQAVRLDPASAEAHAWLAEARIQKWQHSRDKSQLDLAAQSSSRALALNPRLASVHFAAARAAQTRGDWENAATEFKAAIAANPSDPEAYRFLARVYSEMRRNSDAEAIYRKAVDLNPSSWTSYTSLGVFYSRQEKWDAALREFAKARDLYPDLSTVHINLGSAYYKLDRMNEAAKAFETAIQLKPDRVAYTNLGTIRFHERRYADAAGLFENAVAQSPADAHAWCYLGEALVFVRGGSARSAEAFRKAVNLFEADLKVNPNLAATWSRLALTKAFLGDAAGSRTATSQALNIAPDDASVLYRAARTEARLGATQRAAGLLVAALDRGYSTSEARREPGLDEARKDPRLRARF